MGCNEVSSRLLIQFGFSLSNQQYSSLTFQGNYLQKLERYDVLPPNNDENLIFLQLSLSQWIHLPQFVHLLIHQFGHNLIHLIYPMIFSSQITVIIYYYYCIIITIFLLLITFIVVYIMILSFFVFNL